MFNCAKEVLGYHDDKVNLPPPERNEMRDRRNANRDRVKRGLEKNENPNPLEFKTQGSYEMRTMTQHPDKSYDIDDGIYFDQTDLKNSAGNDMSALEARQMVRDAVDDGSFNTKPKVLKNCVRVYYETGYHVDLPVYRRVVTKDASGNEEIYYELASSDWKRSDARDVTAWFKNENERQSPDTTNGRQMCRECRLIKKFARSRESWKGQIGSGFMITKLVTEIYAADIGREDKALYDTMKAMRDRLENGSVVEHPVTPDSTITDGDNDPKAKFLTDKLSDAISWLDVLFKEDCTAEEAMKAWDKVFNTTYFTDTLEAEDDEKQEEQFAKSAAAANSGLLKNWTTSPSPQTPVRKEGGGRYA